jgi:hypothetical protein
MSHVERAARGAAVAGPRRRRSCEPAPAGQAGGSARGSALRPPSRGRRPGSAACPLDPPRSAPVPVRDCGPQPGARRGERSVAPDWHVTGKAHSGRPHRARPISRSRRPRPCPRSGIGITGRDSRQGELRRCRRGSAYPVERCKTWQSWNLCRVDDGRGWEPDRPQLGFGGGPAGPPWNRPGAGSCDSGISPGEGVIRRSVGSWQGIRVWAVARGPFDPFSHGSIGMDLA